MQEDQEDRFFVLNQIIAKKDVTIEHWNQKFVNLRVQYENILEQINT